jgi:protein SCO1/2
MSSSARAEKEKVTKPISLTWFIVGGAILVIVMGVGAYFVGRSLRPYQLHGTELIPPLPAANFTMQSSRTLEPVSLSDFRDKLVFIYFGYATCPDVCPASLAHYTETYHLLSEEEQEQVQLLWITVDPERDTPEVMEDYISHFEPEFMLGLVPRSEEELAETAKAYAAYYAKVDYGSQAGYLMDHSASVPMIDQNGEWSMVYSFNMPPGNVADDIKYLLKNRQQN